MLSPVKHHRSSSEDYGENQSVPKHNIIQQSANHINMSWNVLCASLILTHRDSSNILCISYPLTCSADYPFTVMHLYSKVTWKLTQHDDSCKDVAHFKFWRHDRHSTYRGGGGGGGGGGGALVCLLSIVVIKGKGLRYNVSPLRKIENTLGDKIIKLGRVILMLRTFISPPTTFEFC